MYEPQTLLLAEFYTASAYLNRILFVFFDIENLQNTSKGKIKLQDFFQNLKKYFSEECEVNQKTFNLSTFRQDLNTINSYIEYSIKNPFFNNHKIEKYTSYLNLIYSSSNQLHLMLHSSTKSTVALPQSVLGEINEINPNEIPLITVSSSIIELNKNTSREEETIVTFLNLKRQEKYQNYISKGHKNLAINNFHDAINSFQMALVLNENAEILNLIGWTFSLAGDLNNAKEYSLKAIETDTQYGPALNDYGNYLILEGKIKESIKWFELAKRALNYDNREFAFINAGKAYMQLDMYTEALNEFSLALSFTPHNEELHHAILKIRNSLTTESNQDRLL
jgi:Tfp pilus assembly protein PilF